MVAGGALLIVGAITPGICESRRAQPSRSRSGGDPARRIALRVAAGDRFAGSAESRRLAQGEAGEEARTRSASGRYPAAVKAIATVAASRGQT